jgi:hypothetical protein
MITGRQGSSERRLLQNAAYRPAWVFLNNVVIGYCLRENPPEREKKVSGVEGATAYLDTLQQLQLVECERGD